MSLSDTNMNINNFESKVKNTIKKYNLINKKEKIIVAVSGGKDSMTVLYLLKKFGYKTEAIHINLEMGKWSKDNMNNVKKFCSQLNVPLHIYSFN